jgi:cytochrome P450
MLTDMWVELFPSFVGLTLQLSVRLGFYPSLTLLRYGKRFQKHRKLFHSVFSRAQIHTFEDTQTDEARVLLKGLIESPESYNWLVRR